MPEDRFGDLEPGGRPRGEPKPGPEADPGGAAAPPPARPAPNFTWIVGVVAVILIVGAAVNSLPEQGGNFRGPEPGTRLPEFAAPSATSGLEDDSNVIQRGEAEGQVPPACEVRGPGVVNVCGAPLRPVVVTFVTTGCEGALDLVDEVRRDFPAVRFVGVFSGESLETVAELDRRHGWGFEVAVDPDSPEVFTLYRAGDCPTTVVAEEGGTVAETLLGPLTEERLRSAIRAVAS